MKRLMALLVVGAVMVAATAIGYVQVSAMSATSNGWTIVVDQSSDFGLYNWTSPWGPDHMYQEWWWGRADTDTEEIPLDDLTLDSATNPSVNQILLEYSDRDSQTGQTTVEIDLLYSLGGFGSSASLSEIFTITNLTGDTLNLSIFEYTDFDLAGTILDIDAFGDLTGITQVDGLATATVTPVTTPTHYEIAFFSSLLDSLTDSSLTTLSDSGSFLGAGDITFAFQWDITIPPDGSYEIKKIKELNIVPEPTSLMLLGMGLLGLGGLGMKRKKSF